MEKALGLSFVAALTTFAGGIFVIRHLQNRTLWLRSFVAFGAGFLLAAGMLAMVPHAFEELGEAAALLVLAGYLVTHMFEHALVPHFHFGEETHSHSAGLNRRTFISATTGMTVHSYFDGVAIGSGFLINESMGWLLFLAIVLHKLPDGFTIASLSLASGQSSRTALIAVGILGVGTVAGTLSISLFSHLATAALAVSAGVSIHVAATDLMPEVNRERDIRWSLLFFAGVAAFYLGDMFMHSLQQ
jgi:zinc transporter ZupT